MLPEKASAFAVFVDYDNLLEKHKTLGILDVVTRALLKTPLDSETFRAKCDIRVYGGWFGGTRFTRLAQKVTVAIQEEFPTVVRLPNAAGIRIPITINAELAVALLEEPSFHLFNTYRRKSKPANVRVEDPSVAGCADAECALIFMKKLLKTGSCPKPACGVASPDLIYRHEQKSVDTMLSCDLIYAARMAYDRVILVSGDDDFLPPLRTVLLQGAPASRFHPKANYQPASFPLIGAQLLEMEL